MSYIEKEPLVETLNLLKEDWGKTFTAEGIGFAMEKVQEAPTADVKADTVRKMQERINAHFDSDSDYFRSSHGYIRNVVDQIAKEMLEGNDDNT